MKNLFELGFFFFFGKIYLNCMLLIIMVNKEKDMCHFYFRVIVGFVVVLCGQLAIILFLFFYSCFQTSCLAEEDMDITVREFGLRKTRKTTIFTWLNIFLSIKIV